MRCHVQLYCTPLQKGLVIVRLGGGPKAEEVLAKACQSRDDQQLRSFLSILTRYRSCATAVVKPGLLDDLYTKIQLQSTPWNTAGLFKHKYSSRLPLASLNRISIETCCSPLSPQHFASPISSHQLEYLIHSLSISYPRWARTIQSLRTRHSSLLTVS